MRDAISYKRFSSRMQQGGDSLRRQIAITESYCKREGLKLVDDFFDPGVSGFNGANLGDGTALRALLNAAKEGRFRPGTRLIVESLDRLSRAEISVAVRLFLDLLDAGLVIVTLIEGEQVFTKERVDNDMSAIVIVVLFLMRANQESRVKRERMLQSHKARRDKARRLKIPMSTRCPPWLTVKGAGDQRRFVVNPRRAEIVGNIFQLCLSGMGEHRIVAHLNQRGVRNFHGTALWRGSMVQKILKNPAVYGLYRPCYKVFVDGRVQRALDPEGPIEDYYPPIFAKELFDAVQKVRASRTTARPGRRLLPKRKNLFSGLGYCAVCGSSLYLSQAANGYDYLKCVKGYDWACSNRLGFPYRKLEAVFLALDDLLGLVDELLKRCGTFDLMGAPTLAEEQSTTGHGVSTEPLFTGFRTAKALMGSPQLPDAIEARFRLLGEVRRFCAGVVLHPNRLMTLHMNHAKQGCHVTLLIGPDGLHGIQMRRDTGEIGFITSGVTAGLVKPTGSGFIQGDADRPPWRPASVKDTVERVRIVASPGGDWEAVVTNPSHMADAIVRAEHTLRAASS